MPCCLEMTRARARECRCASSTCQALSKFKFKLQPHKNFNAVWSNKGSASRAKLAVWSVALEHKVSAMRIAWCAIAVISGAILLSAARHDEVRSRRWAAPST